MVFQMTSRRYVPIHTNKQFSLGSSSTLSPKQLFGLTMVAVSYSTVEDGTGSQFTSEEDEVELQLEGRGGWRRKLFSPRVFLVVVAITFLIGILHMGDYIDPNGRLSRAIHGDVSFLQSTPVSYDYENEPNKRNGVMILGAPLSKLPLVTSLLASAGFRVSSEGEVESDLVRQFHYEKGDRRPSMNHIDLEPLQRFDSYDENHILLDSQKKTWHTNHIYRFNTTLVKARIYKDKFLERSHLMSFLNGDELDEKPWVWQDSQLCLTLPAWARVLHTKGHHTDEPSRKTATIFTYDHPMEMAKTLHLKYPQISLVKALRLYADYNYKCISNIQSLSRHLCPIFTSNEELKSNPQTAINNILDTLDERCSIAPGFPGRLGRWGARHDVKQMEQFEKKQLRSYGLSDINLSDNVILDALGLNDFKSSCDYYKKSHKKEKENEIEYEWGSEQLTNAMDELKDLKEDADSKDRKGFNDELNRLQDELQIEIFRWMGDQVSDAIHQLSHLEQETVKFVTEDNSRIRDERTYFMTHVKREIDKAYEDAMQIYCDLNNGKALNKRYHWPQMNTN